MKFEVTKEWLEKRLAICEDASVSAGCRDIEHLRMSSKIEKLRPIFEKWVRCIDRGYHGAVDRVYDLTQVEYYGALERVGVTPTSAEKYFNA